jgi:hypothetical protein
MSKTVDEMKAELEAAGYTFHDADEPGAYGIVIKSPDRWIYQRYLAGSSNINEGYEWTVEEATKHAYKRLQETRRNAANEAFVRKVASMSVFTEQQSLDLGGESVPITLPFRRVFSEAELVNEAKALLEENE